MDCIHACNTCHGGIDCSLLSHTVYLVKTNRTVQPLGDKKLTVAKTVLKRGRENLDSVSDGLLKSEH